MRFRRNNVSGTLGASLTNSGTTITFASVPTNMPTIGSTAHMALILDPDTASQEIVWVTAYTAGQTTATISRGQEGTTGVAHNNGAAWVHGPTRRDIPNGRAGYYLAAQGSTTLTGSTTWANVLTASDQTLTAQADDLIEAGIVWFWNNNAVNARLDIATIVSGSPVSYFSGGTGQTSDVGLVGWTGASGLLVPLGGSVWRRIASADVSAGTVTVRLRYRMDAATNKGIEGPWQFWAKNHGPQETG